MVVSSQLRAGMAVKYQGQPYKVQAAEYHPGQGKMGGVTHARLQNLDTGTLWEHSFRSELKFDEITLEKLELEFLYADGGQCCFMNQDSFEQTEIAAGIVGRVAPFMEPGMKLVVEFVGGRAVGVIFPDILEVKIGETAPPAHQQADSAFKPAKLANGFEVMVPQFIKVGDIIRLDIETMKYVDRVRADVRR
jgi:elongation factor P